MKETSIQCIYNVPKTKFKYNTVSKLIGSKVLRQLQYIGETPHKYVHIDMKFNFMHNLAKIGFGGVSPIYWIKEVKHTIIYTFNKYAYSRLSTTKRRYSLNKTSVKPRRHTKV